MRRRLCGVVLATAVAGAVPCEAALAVRKSVDPKDVPAWAKEAAARPAPATAAAAVILHHEEIFEPQPDRGVRRTLRVVAKILKREALDDFGTFDATYRKDDRVLALRAWTFLPDGTIRIPDPTLDFLEQPYVQGGSVFEDTWARSVDAASGSTGATIAYEFVVLEDLDLGAGPFTFGNERYPTVLSRASVAAPPGWETAWVLSGDPGATCSRTSGGIVCEARDLPVPPAEDFRPPASDVLPRCWLRWWSPDGSRGFRDWDAVGVWAEQLTRPVLADVGDAARTSERLKPGDASGLLPAIGRAFEHAARDVRYVSIQLGIGGYRPHPPALVAKRMFGDCKDKAFFLRAIAEGWGVTSYFLLVSTRGHGTVHDDVPTPAQFDHMIAAVALPDGAGADVWSTIGVEGLGRLLLLDATAREGSAWDLRDDIQGTLALLVVPGGGRLVRLPMQPPDAARFERTLRAEVDDQGALVGATIGETWTGSLAAEMRAGWAPVAEAERRRALEAVVQASVPGSALQAYRFEGLESVDGVVRREATLRGGWFGKRVVSMLIVQPGRVSRGFVDGALPPPPRRHDVALDFPKTERVDAEVKVPPGWRPDGLPRVFALETPEISAHASWAVEGERVLYRREAKLLVSAVKPERYAAFRDAVMKLNGADDQGVVLVRGN